MYKCQKCGCVVGPRKEMNKVVTIIRDVNYQIMKQVKDEKGKPLKGKFFLHSTVKGTEIVKEKCVCSNCAESLIKRGPVNIGKVSENKVVFNSK